MCRHESGFIPLTLCCFQSLCFWTRLSRVHKLTRTAVKCESYHSMIMSRHFFPWCMFSYKLRMRTMYGPPDTRQWSSTSRLALGQSYRIWETERDRERQKELSHYTHVVYCCVSTLSGFTIHLYCVHKMSISAQIVVDNCVNKSCQS